MTAGMEATSEEPSASAPNGGPEAEWADSAEQTVARRPTEAMMRSANVATSERSWPRDRMRKMRVPTSTSMSGCKSCISGISVVITQMVMKKL